MTPLFAAAPVAGLSPLELFELVVAACFCTGVCTWAGTAWWMKARFAAESEAEMRDAMVHADEPEPERLARVYRLPARYQLSSPALRVGLHHGERVD